jgi:hypothetical protein
MKYFYAQVFIFLVSVQSLFAQGPLQRINDLAEATSELVVAAAGVGAIWSGIEFIKGNPAAAQRLVMCVFGGVIAIAGQQLIKFFVS